MDKVITDFLPKRLKKQTILNKVSVRPWLSMYMDAILDRTAVSCQTLQVDVRVLNRAC